MKKYCKIIIYLESGVNGGYPEIVKIDDVTGYRLQDEWLIINTNKKDEYYKIQKIINFDVIKEN